MSPKGHAMTESIHTNGKFGAPGQVSEILAPPRILSNDTTTGIAVNLSSIFTGTILLQSATDPAGAWSTVATYTAGGSYAAAYTADLCYRLSCTAMRGDVDYDLFVTGVSAQMSYKSDAYQQAIVTRNASPTSIAAAGGALVLGKVIGPVVSTGSTAYVQMGRILIPKNTLRNGSIIEVHSIYEATSSANAKNANINLNISGAGTSGANTFYNNGGFTTAHKCHSLSSLVFQTKTSQIGGLFNSNGGIGGVTSVTGLQSSTFDPDANDLEITFYGQLANASETFTLHAFWAGLVL